MKNLIIIFILSSLLWNCSPQKDENLIVFEYILGKENTKTLDYIVSDFENDFLKNTYPDISISEAYEMFLIDLENENTSHFKKISNKTRKLFNESLLRLEIYEYPDSVWIERDTSKMSIKDPKGVVKKKYKYVNEDGVNEYSTSEGSINYFNISEDSIISIEKRIVQHNNIGKYMMALYIIKNSSPFLKKFYDYRKDGYINSKILSEVMLDSKLNFKDPFIRRLIVLEFVY
jgi:hypothetical protein